MNEIHKVKDMNSGDEMRESSQVRLLSRTELEQRAARYALASADDSALQEHAEWVIFQVADEQFTLNLNVLDEIAMVQRGTALPGLHPAILGLINLRGNTLLLVDTAQAMGLRQAAPGPSDRQRVLVVGDSHDEAMGLLVDRIVSVADLGFNAYDTPESERLTMVDAVSHVQGRLVGRIDLDRLTNAVRGWAAG